MPFPGCAPAPSPFLFTGCVTTGVAPDALPGLRSGAFPVSIVFGLCNIWGTRCAVLGSRPSDSAVYLVTLLIATLIWTGGLHFAPAPTLTSAGGPTQIPTWSCSVGVRVVFCGHQRCSSRSRTCFRARRSGVGFALRRPLWTMAPRAPHRARCAPQPRRQRLTVCPRDVFSPRGAGQPAPPPRPSCTRASSRPLSRRLAMLPFCRAGAVAPRRGL